MVPGLFETIALCKNPFLESSALLNKLLLLPIVFILSFTYYVLPKCLVGIYTSARVFSLESNMLLAILMLLQIVFHIIALSSTFSK